MNDLNASRPEAIAFLRLLDIMDELREKCPWDRKQTIESLRHLTIEETFELSDAISEGDLNEVRNELGDLLLHIVFYSKIASETNQFTIENVISQVCEKLIRRHPHIYGDIKADDEEAVKKNWERIKQEERKEKNVKTGVLSGVPKTLPALIKSTRIQEKARAVGFDWSHKGQVWDKIQEELKELEEEEGLKDNHDKLEDEFGDVLFALVNYARFLKVNPEDALEKTNKKFIKRFNYIETKAEELGIELKNMPLDQMEHFWQEAKTLA